MDISTFDPILRQSGTVALYFKNLETGQVLEHNPATPMLAASVIKLAVLVHAFTLVESGRLNRAETLTLKEEDKLPSCGALNMMHAGLELTVEDLYTLMITLSDNTATNLLINRFGMQNINATMRELGCTQTTLNRVMFDSAAAERGLENYVCAAEMGMLLERMYRGTLVSPAASEAMLGILRQQKLKGKLPLALPRGTAVAHKTGDDGHITHDVGIVFARQPFVLCILANHVDAPEFEMALHRAVRRAFEACNC